MDEDRDEQVARVDVERAPHVPSDREGQQQTDLHVLRAEEHTLHEERERDGQCGRERLQDEGARLQLLEERRADTRRERGERERGGRAVGGIGELGDDALRGVGEVWQQQLVERLYEVEESERRRVAAQDGREPWATHAQAHPRAREEGGMAHADELAEQRVEGGLLEDEARREQPRRVERQPEQHEQRDQHVKRRREQ